MGFSRMGRDEGMPSTTAGPATSKDSFQRKDFFDERGQKLEREKGAFHWVKAEKKVSFIPCHPAVSSALFEVREERERPSAIGRCLVPLSLLWPLEETSRFRCLMPSAERLSLSASDRALCVGEGAQIPAHVTRVTTPETLRGEEFF